MIPFVRFSDEGTDNIGNPTHPCLPQNRKTVCEEIAIRVIKGQCHPPAHRAPLGPFTQRRKAAPWNSLQFVYLPREKPGRHMKTALTMKERWHADRMIHQDQKSLRPCVLYRLKLNVGRRERRQFFPFQSATICSMQLAIDGIIRARSNWARWAAAALM